MDPNSSPPALSQILGSRPNWTYLFDWTSNIQRKRILDMPSGVICERNGLWRSARGGCVFGDGYARTSPLARLARFMLLGVGAYLSFVLSSGVAIRAQTSDSQSDVASKS